MWEVLRYARVFIALYCNAFLKQQNRFDSSEREQIFCAAADIVFTAFYSIWLEQLVNENMTIHMFAKKPFDRADRNKKKKSTREAQIDEAYIVKLTHAARQLDLVKEARRKQQSREFPNHLHAQSESESDCRGKLYSIVDLAWMHCSKEYTYEKNRESANNLDTIDQKKNKRKGYMELFIGFYFKNYDEPYNRKRTVSLQKGYELLKLLLEKLHKERILESELAARKYTACALMLLRFENAQHFLLTEWMSARIVGGKTQWSEELSKRFSLFWERWSVPEILCHNYKGKLLENDLLHFDCYPDLIEKLLDKYDYNSLQDKLLVLRMAMTECLSMLNDVITYTPDSDWSKDMFEWFARRVMDSYTILMPLKLSEGDAYDVCKCVQKKFRTQMHAAEHTPEREQMAKMKETMRERNKEGRKRSIKQEAVDQNTSSS